MAFYQLRHPLLALDLIWEHVARPAEFQSMQRQQRYRALKRITLSRKGIDKPGFRKLHFVERAYCRRHQLVDPEPRPVRGDAA
jgi:tRNA (mo5U34)-methyltransferase